MLERLKHNKTISTPLIKHCILNIELDAVDNVEVQESVTVETCGTKAAWLPILPLHVLTLQFIN